MVKKIVMLGLFCFAMTGMLWAQAVSVAQITGNVKDQSGALLPGAANDFVPTSAGQSLTSNKNYPTASAVSIAGGQGGQTLYLVDGGYNMDPVSNVGLPLPFPDAMREFKVETSSLPANYGTQPGGVVNVVTKSGTNQFHGAGFEFLRNYALNARNFFAPRLD